MTSEPEPIDPNEKLQIDFQKMKADPYQMTTDRVLSWRAQEWISAKGNVTIRVNYSTEYGSFAIWYMPRKYDVWASLCQATIGYVATSVEEYTTKIDAFEATMPKTITVKKNKKTKFYECFGHNQKEDELI